MARIRRKTRRDTRRMVQTATGAALIVLSLAGLAGMFYLAAAADCQLDPAPYPAAIFCN